MPLFAVGEATGAAARAAGFHDVTAGAGEGAALVAADRRDPADTAAGRCIYAAARDLSGNLAEHLEEAGYDLQMVEAYRAERAESLSPALAAALAAGTIDGALFYSRRTAETFRDLVAGRPDPAGACLRPVGAGGRAACKGLAGSAACCGGAERGQPSGVDSAAVNPCRPTWPRRDKPVL